MPRRSFDSQATRRISLISSLYHLLPITHHSSIQSNPPPPPSIAVSPPPANYNKNPHSSEKSSNNRIMDKLDKLKIASSSLGERLKTGGAQMSRIVSSKMKDLLQAPTPESKIVDEATLETMEGPNWGLNLRICAMINSEELSGTEIVKAVKKKLMGKSPVAQRLALDLLETCSSNCEKVFSEVASEKVLEDMMKVVEDPKTDHENRVKAMQLIRAWGESQDLAYLPVFRQTYMNMKEKANLSGMPDNNAPELQHHLGTYLDEDSLTAPENYPVPNQGFRDAESDMLVTHGGLSVEEKREFLVVTRNTLDLLSSILNSEDGPKPSKNELAMSLLDNCKQSMTAVQRIIEGTVDDEGLLIEALGLHDELQQVVTRCEQMEEAAPEEAAPVEAGESVPKHVGSGSETPQPDKSDANDTTSVLQVDKDDLKDAEKGESSKIEALEASSGSRSPAKVVSENEDKAGGKEKLPSD